jgi:CheY-like chemotaxis protein
MAKILVSEADPDVRRLLIVLVRRLGHEAVVIDPGVAVPPRADLVLAEPGPDVPELPVVSTTKPFTIAQLRRQIEHSLSVAPA